MEFWVLVMSVYVLGKKKWYLSVSIDGKRVTLLISQLGERSTMWKEHTLLTLG